MGVGRSELKMSGSRLKRVEIDDIVLQMSVAQRVWISVRGNGCLQMGVGGSMV